MINGHIEVEFLVRRLSKKAQSIVTCIVSILGIALFIVLAWRSVDYGLKLQASGEVSMTQEIPFYPFVHVIAFCCVMVALVLLVQLMKNIVRMKDK